jgi:iron complex outermembrane receptor protein
MENYGAELIASYRLNPHLVFNTNHSLLHMKNAVAYAPKYKGLVGANYQCGRFGATANLQYINGLYTRVTPVETTDNFFLLNASLSYRLCPAFQLWARGENLLAQDYEIMYGFPMPHATFMGGVTIDF